MKLRSVSKGSVGTDVSCRMTTGWISKVERSKRGKTAPGWVKAMGHQTLINCCVPILTVVVGLGSAMFIAGGGGNPEFAARYWARAATTQPGPVYVDPEDPRIGTFTIDRPFPGLFVVRGRSTGTIRVFDPTVRKLIGTCGLTIAVLLVLYWERRVALQRKMSSRLSRGQCRKCGYDLRSSPSRCPECGTQKIASGTEKGRRPIDRALMSPKRKFLPSAVAASLLVTVLAAKLNADESLSTAVRFTPKAWATLPVWDWEASRALLRRVQFSSDGQRLLAATDQNIHVWEGTKLTALQAVQTVPPVSIAELSSDGQKVLFFDGRGDLTLWNVNLAKPTWSRRFPDGIAFATLSPDGRRTLVIAKKSHAAQLLDASTGKELFAVIEREWDLPDRVPPARPRLTAAVFAPDSKTFLTVGTYCTPRVWASVDGSALRSFKRPAFPPVAYDERGRVFYRQIGSGARFDGRTVPRRDGAARSRRWADCQRARIRLLGGREDVGGRVRVVRCRVGLRQLQSDNRQAKI